MGYGLHSHDSRARMHEAGEILARAWTEAPFVCDGTYLSGASAGVATTSLSATASPHLA
ncbi:hypothetical protein NKDENANG_00775 [Candidatus Entotheonellaceae bacterium PAL068K]